MAEADLAALVDGTSGLIDRRVFVDEEVFVREVEQIFGRSWLYVCHSSQLRKAHDYFTTYMGVDPVVAVRQPDGSVKVLLNTCRHRGMRVCRADGGNARSFTCTYHGWTYGSDGALLGVPNFEDGYRSELPLGEWGLPEVVRVTEYKGLVFANFDTSAPALLDYLGDMAYYLDVILDRVDGGTEVVPGVHKWRMQGNWKLAAEQFAGDLYHTQVSHVSAIMAEIDPARMQELMNGVGMAPTTAAPRRQVYPGNGHGVGVAAKELNPDLVDPVVARYLDDTQAEAERRLGQERARDCYFMSGNVFPTFSYLNNITIRVWHPKSAALMEPWSWCLVESKAPEEVKHALWRGMMRHFSPAGTWEQDDGENFSYCAGPALGHGASRYPLNYQMGLGHSWDEEGWPGRISDFLSEQNQRYFYEWWSGLMGAQSWSDVPLSPSTAGAPA